MICAMCFAANHLLNSLNRFVAFVAPLSGHKTQNKTTNRLSFGYIGFHRFRAKKEKFALTIFVGAFFAHFINANYGNAENTENTEKKCTITHSKS